MPKMKTNRLAAKKLRLNAKGKARHARANTSHNTGKKSSKRMRHLSGTMLVDATHSRDVRRLLPNG
jgi:large subunit ribosomal protein L35